MKGNDEIKELIAYYKHLFSHVWNALLLLTGGLAGLLFKADHPVAYRLLLAGLPLWMFFVLIVLYTHIRARKLIRRLGNE